MKSIAVELNTLNYIVVYITEPFKEVASHFNINYRITSNKLSDNNIITYDELTCMCDP